VKKQSGSILTEAALKAGAGIVNGILICVQRGVKIAKSYQLN
jgi:hypothetical protein